MSDSNFKQIVEEFEYSLSFEHLKENTTLYNNLADDMRIKLDQYINSVDSKTRLTRDTVISLIKFSPNFTYNSATDFIELRTKPLKNRIIIDLGLPKNKEVVVSQEKLSELAADLQKNIVRVSTKEDSYSVLLDSEVSSLALEKKLADSGVEVKVLTENIKERIMENKQIFSSKVSYNPRKFSENPNEGGAVHKKSVHKNSIGSNNKFDIANEVSGSDNKGKRSFNKYDSVNTIQLPLNKNYNLSIPQPGHYSFKELSSLFWNMKQEKKLSYPKEWEGLGLDELTTQEGKQNLEHFRPNNKDRYRDRANTEVYQFKKPAYNHKKSYNDDYWNVKRSYNFK